MLETEAIAHPAVAAGLQTVLLVGGSSELRIAVEDLGHNVKEAAGGEEAAVMLGHFDLDLVIAEASLPDGSAVDLCRRLRAHPRTELTPVLLLAEEAGLELEIAAMGAGADALLARPCHPAALRMRVRSLLRRKSVVDQRESSESILHALALAVDQRDNVTAGHCDRLAALGVALGMALGLHGDQLLTLHRGGYLHDIGKIGMPDSVLFKAGPLTAEEWAVMRTHTVRGEEICRPIRSLEPVLPIVRGHHERWNGSGYPDGLAGRDIPLLARIMQLADVYDALTSERSYKQAMKPEDALRTMRDEEARGWYDPDLMRVFLKLRHEEVRKASERHSAEWLDTRSMLASLENLLGAVRGS
jgi:putative two-component system response regulator